MKPIIYITRKLPEEAVAPLRRKFNIRMWDSESETVPRAILLKEVAEADALWSVIADRIDKEVFEVAKEKGIVITNTPGVLTETTADLAFALLLATARGVTEAENELRKGNWVSWSPMEYTGMDVGGATLGIIGMGRIGEAVARRGKGFGMRVLYHNRSRKLETEATLGVEYVALDDLLKESDFVVILAPFTPETVGLIGACELRLMKNTAVLINVARGGIVDETALYEALKNDTIWAAGLDVFEEEPVSLDHPLLTLPNVTVLPHIGSASIRTRLAMMDLNANAIIDVFEGREPKNRVV